MILGKGNANMLNKTILLTAVAPHYYQHYCESNVWAHAHLKCVFSQLYNKKKKIKSHLFT